MQKAGTKKTIRKPQHQQRPGKEYKMTPPPRYDYPEKPGANRLAGKVAAISGGDSGIGRAVAVLFAKEGADVAIIYLSEHSDAKEVKEEIEKKYKRKCLLIAGDISKEKHCITAIKKIKKEYNKLDILVNNAAVQFEKKGLEEITAGQLLKTFSTNIFSFFWLTKAALPFLMEGAVIINTASVTAYRGSSNLIDYSSTKGAIVSFTRSLASNLVSKGIRVNAVAPGPVWTPLIVSSFKPSKVAKFGSDAPMERAAEPAEIAPSYLFLASDDSIFITGQVIHPNGGEIING
ncbi:MAG TPA: SDR family oxidoreductase, partial [Ferruginibacter sp.]|nr:SDR family oxidoreductase [Ferruginibacter sp.]